MKKNEKREKEIIEKHIDELRDVLNEICVTQQDTEDLKKRLIISQQLDILIVQYMSINKKDRYN